MKPTGFTLRVAIESGQGYAAEFQQLPQEPLFRKGCSSCLNYGILKRKKYQDRLCIAMVFMPPETLKSVHHGD